MAAVTSAQSQNTTGKTEKESIYISIFLLLYCLKVDYIQFHVTTAFFLKLFKKGVYW